MFHVSKTLKKGKSSMILNKFDKGFLSFDIFILRFEKSHAGGLVQLEICLVLPNFFFMN